MHLSRSIPTISHSGESTRPMPSCPLACICARACACVIQLCGWPHLRLPPLLYGSLVHLSAIQTYVHVTHRANATSGVRAATIFSRFCFGIGFSDCVLNGDNVDTCSHPSMSIEA